MASVRIERITKRFGSVTAVSELSLEVVEGEFFCLVGPSGCGKTTTLRILAGFERPTEGEIYFGEERVTDRPPQARGVGLVFQSYAIFPTMNVFGNVAYGLEVRKVPATERGRRVREALLLVGLQGLEGRMPSQLSSGQLQRVALARALVIQPHLLLLDEPLSNLDAKLRLGIRREIRRIQRDLSITTIYVTHDQEEALSLADRIGVMQSGRLEQIGSPLEVYTHPRTAFVAGFLGQTTLLVGRVEAVTAGEAVIAVGEGLHLTLPSVDGLSPGDRVWCSLRPEGLIPEGSDPPPPIGVPIAGVVSDLEFLGSVARGELSVPGLPTPILFEVAYPNRRGLPKLGAAFRAWIDLGSVRYGPMA